MALRKKASGKLAGCGEPIYLTTISHLSTLLQRKRPIIRLMDDLAKISEARF